MPAKDTQFNSETGRQARAKQKRCNARCRRTKKPCNALAMANGKCKHHGGRHQFDGRPKGKSRLANMAVTAMGGTFEAIYDENGQYVGSIAVLK